MSFYWISNMHSCKLAINNHILIFSHFSQQSPKIRRMNWSNIQPKCKTVTMTLPKHTLWNVHTNCVPQGRNWMRNTTNLHPPPTKGSMEPLSRFYTLRDPSDTDKYWSFYCIRGINIYPKWGRAVQVQHPTAAQQNMCFYDKVSSINSLGLLRKKSES